MKHWVVIIGLWLSLGSPLALASGGWNSGLSANIVDNMWQLMEWFSGRNERDRYGPYRGWRDGPYDSLAPLRRPPSADWADIGGLEGVWQAQSGEYWVVRRGRFVLYPAFGGMVQGDYLREGHFLRLFGPWGERQFEFRQMGDVMMMQDVTGQLSILRRVQSAHWAW